MANLNSSGQVRAADKAQKSKSDKHGWTRTVRARATDVMKSRWTRSDDKKGNIDERARFDTERSAYDLDDNTHLRKECSLVTLDPERGVVDSKIKIANGTESELVSYCGFRNTCEQLRMEYDGHIRMNLRCDYQLSNSTEAVMSLSKKDLRKSVYWGGENRCRGIG